MLIEILVTSAEEKFTYYTKTNRQIGLKLERKIDKDF